MQLEKLDEGASAAFLGSEYDDVGSSLDPLRLDVTVADEVEVGFMVNVAGCFVFILLFVFGQVNVPH